jgi:AbrB family looped-hinge helix DNA binding protein
MQVTLSSKGQLVLPAPIRRRLRLKARAKLDLEERDGGVFLRPATRSASMAPVAHAAPGSLKFGPRDRALDQLAADLGEDDAP